MDEKTNLTPGTSADRDGDTNNDQSGTSAGSSTSSQAQKGFVPMNLIDDLWPDSEETLVSQGKVAMAELFDAETESNVTPISAADLVSAPAPDPSARVEPTGFRSVSDFEQEFKDYGSIGSEDASKTGDTVVVGKSDVAEKVPASSTLETKSSEQVKEMPPTPPPAIAAPTVIGSVEDEPVIDESASVQTTATESLFVYNTDDGATIVEETVSISSTITEPTPQSDPFEEVATIAPTSDATVSPVEPTPQPAPSTTTSSAVADFLRGADESVPSTPVAADESAVAVDASGIAITGELAPVVAPQPTQVEESPVPTAIAEQAEAEAREINERKLAMARAQMAAAQGDGVYETASEQPTDAPEEPIEQGISVITREATVLGDIITQGHIDIVGRVKGNIDAKGDVAIHGIVRGDVGGSKIGLYDCRVKGNLDAALGVIVDESSIIGGDVKTKNIIFDGKVKGNIDAENVVVLRSHSLTLGDVTAASLAVEPGAILNGTVRTLVGGDLEAPFEEVM